MVNLVAAERSLLRPMMKMAGIRPHTVEIEPGTLMNIWLPSETIKMSKNSGAESYQVIKPKSNKPVVVLIHGFAGDGIFNWQFQVGSLAKNYSVYVPDLLFFGGSTTDSLDRSLTFQAECLVKALRKLGVEKCFSVVGFSYGGMVAFKMAEIQPEFVEAMVISSSVPAMTDSIRNKTLKSLGVSSFARFLLPNDVKGCKRLLKAGAHKKLWWLPDRLYKDFLEVMYNNRKELVGLVKCLDFIDKENNITNPKFPQRILLLWGEKDSIFTVELASNLKEQLGDKVTLEGIKKAGHLVHIERPLVFNKCVKKFLASLHADVIKPKK